MGSCHLGRGPYREKGCGNRVTAQPPLSAERDYRPALPYNDALYQRVGGGGFMSVMCYAEICRNGVWVLC
ncbi:hypothetical protein CEXT_718901 [Caerostris extrusa]|uniref:Uncharacterized protein n=1 Tax=Caerostris extrusa TaxID=172846 RepID=A0AAV4PWH4_CAEEX|nr:hypothetical protein CEXT_718901 [Caerostris extrusa]